MAAMFRTWLVRDRERFGYSAAQVAGRLRITRAEYMQIESGARWPDSTTWERLVELFGWPT
jgi:transcriptional regulator with XRE-family HTH domain